MQYTFQEDMIISLDSVIKDLRIHIYLKKNPCPDITISYEYKLPFLDD